MSQLEPTQRVDCPKCRYLFRVTVDPKPGWEVEAVCPSCEYAKVFTVDDTQDRPRPERREIEAVRLVSEVALFGRMPEELLLEAGGARGLTVRLHRLGWFLIEVVAVVEQGEAVRVVRYEIKVGPRYVATSQSREEFACRPCFLAKLDRQLARLGVAEIESFAEEDVLDGVSVECRYRGRSGNFRQVNLFCWDASPDREVRRFGDFLAKFAQSSMPELRRRAWLSRFW